MTDTTNKPNGTEAEKTESLGIPSVAARKQNNSRVGTFSALLLILVLLIVIGFTKKTKPTQSRMTNRRLNEVFRQNL